MPLVNNWKVKMLCGVPLRKKYYWLVLADLVE